MASRESQGFASALSPERLSRVPKRRVARSSEIDSRSLSAYVFFRGSVAHRTQASDYPRSYAGFLANLTQRGFTMTLMFLEMAFWQHPDITTILGSHQQVFRALVFELEYETKGMGIRRFPQHTISAGAFS
jgi:hypothetical protein